MLLVWWICEWVFLTGYLWLIWYLYDSSLLGAAAAAVVILVAFGRCNRQSAGYPVELTDDEFAKYWSQLERRLPNWFEQHDLVFERASLPDGHEVRETVVFFEVSPEDVATCYFRAPNRVVIGSDKWNSGCVAHELGHMTLYMADHPCWRNFEHPGEEEKCREKLS